MGIQVRDPIEKQQDLVERFFRMKNDKKKMDSHRSYPIILTLLFVATFLYGCGQFDSRESYEEKQPLSIPKVLHPVGSIRLPFSGDCFENNHSPTERFVDFPTPMALVKDSLYLINHCASDALLKIEAIKLIVKDGNNLAVADTLRIENLRSFEFFNFSKMEGWDFGFEQRSRTALLIPQEGKQVPFSSTNNFDDFPPTIQHMVSINQTLIYRDLDDQINYYFILAPKEDSIIVSSGKGSVLGLNEEHQQLFTHGREANGRVDIFHGEKSVTLDLSEQLNSQTGHFDIWYDQDSRRLFLFFWNWKEDLFSIYLFLIE